MRYALVLWGLQEKRVGQVSGSWADAFIGFADTLVDDYDVLELAEQLIDRLMALLPIAAAVMLLGDENAKLTVFAASGEHARLVEVLQADTDAGPCLEAYTRGEQVVIEDLRRDSERWPALAGLAREYEFGSAYALPLRLRQERLGSLNLFCREGQVLSANEIAAGQALADMAAIGILNHRVPARADSVNGHLQAALNSRVAIEQATGILAERGNIDTGRAFALLRSHARSAGQHLADVASKIVKGASIVIIDGLDEARRQEARNDACFRRLMDNAAIGMCLIAPDGRFQEVNDALCQLFGYDAQTLTHKTWQELTAPDYLHADLQNVNDVLEGRIDSYRMTKQYIHADGHPIWGDLAVSCTRDEHGHVENFISQVTDITGEVEAREQLAEAYRQQARADERYRLTVDHAAVAMCLTTPNGRFTDVNDAMCRYFGYNAQTLSQMTWQDLTAPDYLESDLINVGKIMSGQIDSYRLTKQFIHADGHRIWGDLSVGCRRKPGGNVDWFIAQITDTTREVTLAQQLQQQNNVIRQQAIAGERFRRSMDNAAVAMCLVTPEGRFKEVNDAACQFFGLDAEALRDMTFQDVTPQEYLDAELKMYNDLMEGRIGSYRMVKHYLRADAQVIWGDITVSCIRDESGRVSEIVGQIIDVTAEVQARQQLADQSDRNCLLAQRLQQKTDRIASELGSAATYMASIMPRGLHGPVEVSSRYLPSRELGGDCFDYHWIDDDHLLVYLIDVSGHGLEPALLSVSVHNMLRSGSITTQTLLVPEAVLAELNRLFQMDQQHDQYFTAWYGVYERSTRTLRYASAGAPPAYAFTTTTGNALTATELNTQSSPVGVFEDTEFTAGSYSVPPGCKILLFSDGANEVVLADGKQLSLEGFKTLATKLAGSANWSLDKLIDRLRALTSDGDFEDDCSLIQMTFD